MVWAVRVKRTRPVAAATTCVVEAAIDTVASSGQEKTVAVTSCEEPTVHAVLGCPGDGSVVKQFLEFRLSGHAPSIAPVGRGRVVLRQEGSQVEVKPL